VTASKVLEITLTAANKSKGIETPLCGFPPRRDGYIAKLIRRGFKVAVCSRWRPEARQGYREARG